MRESKELRPLIRELTEANGGKPTMNLKRAAEILGCDPRTLQKNMKLKKAGGRYMISTVALAEWMVNYD